MSDWLSIAVAIRMKQRNDAIEKALEEALQGGLHGVIVGENRSGTKLKVGVSPLVPYGEIYHYILEDSDFDLSSQ